MIDLTPHIETIAQRVLGTPNAKFSTRDQLRFGTQAEKHELSELYEAKIRKMKVRVSGR